MRAPLLVTGILAGVALALSRRVGGGQRGLFVAHLRSYKGTPYQLGGAPPSTFDCGSLVSWCYGLLGLEVARTVTEQYENAPYSVDLRPLGGSTGALGILQPGDCIGFDWEAGGRFSHVGVWTGQGTIIHAAGQSSSGKVVEVPWETFHRPETWRGVYSYL